MRQSGAFRSRATTPFPSSRSPATITAWPQSMRQAIPTHRPARSLRLTSSTQPKATCQSKRTESAPSDATNRSTSGPPHGRHAERVTAQHGATFQLYSLQFLPERRVEPHRPPAKTTSRLSPSHPMRQVELRSVLSPRATYRSGSSILERASFSFSRATVLSMRSELGRACAITGTAKRAAASSTSSA